MLRILDSIAPYFLIVSTLSLWIGIIFLILLDKGFYELLG